MRGTEDEQPPILFSYRPIEDRVRYIIRCAPRRAARVCFDSAPYWSQHAANLPVEHDGSINGIYFAPCVHAALRWLQSSQRRPQYERGRVFSRRTDDGFAQARCAPSWSDAKSEFPFPLRLADFVERAVAGSKAEVSNPSERAGAPPHESRSTEPARRRQARISPRCQHPSRPHVRGFWRAPPQIFECVAFFRDLLKHYRR